MATSGEKARRRFAGAAQVVMVCFEERNLMDADASFWQAAFSTIISCRNVMIVIFSTAAVPFAGRPLCPLAWRREGFFFLV